MAQRGKLIILLEYLTLLLEYLDLFQSLQQIFGRAWALPGLSLAMSLGIIQDFDQNMLKTQNH